MKSLLSLLLFTISLQAFANTERCLIDIQNITGGMIYLEEEDEQRVDQKVLEILHKKGYSHSNRDEASPSVLEYSIGFGGCSQSFFGEYSVNFSGSRDVSEEWSDGIDLTEPTTEEDFERIETSTFDGLFETIESLPSCPGFE